MSLTDMVIMPGADYQAACDAIREKTEGVGYIRSGDMAELIRGIETGNSNVQYITLPKGRMRGDVNGDGLITSEDAELILNISVELVTPTEVQRWCADVNADGRIDSTDKVMVDWLLAASPSSALTATPTMADYYGNWTWEKVDDTSGYFYFDVPVDGVTEETVATMLVDSFEKVFIEPVFMDGVVRVRAKGCPTSEVQLCLMLDGKTWLNAPPVDNSEPDCKTEITNATAGFVLLYSKNYPNGQPILPGAKQIDYAPKGSFYAILYDSSITNMLWGNPPPAAQISGANVVAYPSSYAPGAAGLAVLQISGTNADFVIIQ